MSLEKKYYIQCSNIHMHIRSDNYTNYLSIKIRSPGFSFMGGRIGIQNRRLIPMNRRAVMPVPPGSPCNKRILPNGFLEVSRFRSDGIRDLTPLS